MRLIKRIVACLLIISLLILVGCVEKEITPTLEQPAPAAEETVEVPVVEEAPIIEEPEAVDEVIPEPEPVVEETKKIEEKENEELLYLEVEIREDKKMYPQDFRIRKGTTVRWINKDTDKFYHHLLIQIKSEDEIIPTTKVVAESGRLDSGEYWEHAFNKKGDYTVRDIFAGSLKNEITAEAIQALTPEELETSGEIIGNFYVDE